MTGFVLLCWIMKLTLKKIYDNKIFEWSVVTVIILSALLIGAKTYHLSPFFVQFLTYADWAITLFFLVEISIRFIADDDKRRFFKNGWNVFDTLIVVVSLIPIEDSEMALIGRLVRVFRVLRMVSIVPELRILINSLLKAMPQLSYVMLLMFIIFYIYGAVGSFFFNEINPVLWGDITTSMLTLFRVMTFEDWTDYKTLAQAIILLTLFTIGLFYLKTMSYNKKNSNNRIHYKLDNNNSKPYQVGWTDS